MIVYQEIVIFNTWLAGYNENKLDMWTVDR